VVVKRIKVVWFIAWLCVTGFAFVGWGFEAAVVAWLAFVGVSLLAFIAFILNLLLGDASVALRILLIVLFIAGLLIELFGIASSLPMTPWLWIPLILAASALLATTAWAFFRPRADTIRADYPHGVSLVGSARGGPAKFRIVQWQRDPADDASP